MLKLLDDLRVRERRGVKRAYRGARNVFKAVKQRKEIESRRQRLHEINGQLASRVLQILRSNLADHSDLLVKIEQSSSSATEAVLQSKTAVLKALLNQHQRRNSWSAKHDVALARLDSGHKVLQNALSSGFDSLDRAVSITASQIDEEKGFQESRNQKTESAEKSRKISTASGIRK